MDNALARRIDKIVTGAAIKSRDVAQLLDTTPETVSRWRAGRVEPQKERLIRLLELEYLVDALSEIYEPQDARMWLFKRHRLLNGDTPADRIRAGQLDEVLAIVDQIRSGAYV